MKLDRRFFIGAAAATVGTGLVGRPVLAGAQMPKFVVDHMMVRPGRYLRAAGYDTLVAPVTVNLSELAALGLAEDRVIVSRRAKLASHPDARGRALYVTGKNLADVAREMTAELNIDWQHDPLSRCVACNNPLVEVDANAWWHGATPGQRPIAEMLPLTHCSSCDQLFWRGDHASDMQARLNSWSTGQFV